MICFSLEKFEKLLDKEEPLNVEQEQRQLLLREKTFKKVIFHTERPADCSTSTEELIEMLSETNGYCFGTFEFMEFRDDIIEEFYNVRGIPCMRVV